MTPAEWNAAIVLTLIVLFAVWSIATGPRRERQSQARIDAAMSAALKRKKNEGTTT
jgi:hypothetical protein